MKVKYRLDITWGLNAAWVVEIATKKRSQEYDLEEAKHLKRWLEERAEGYPALRLPAQ
jgi:hypothetical protein